MQQGFWKGKSALVTGATGFVGSWLSRRLLDEGARVVTVARDRVLFSNYFDLGLDREISEVSGALEDFPLVLRTVSEYEVTHCFHLAAQAIVGVANRSPLSTFESNIRGTWNLMEALRLCPTLEGAVIASSDKAYGISDDLPYRETHPLTPKFPYDTSKACADLIARSYHATFGVPVAVTRFANIYGGGDLNFSRIVPDTVRSVLRGERPVIRSDGTPERDFVHVSDAVDLYLEVAAGLPAEGIAGGVFNGGHNKPVKILDLVGKIALLAGRPDLEPDVRGVNAGHGEIDRQWLDATLARETFGWKPAVGLDQGLSEAIAWYRSYFARASK